MATANIRFSDLSSISFNDDWKGCANYQRVPFAQKFLPTDYMTVQFAINSDAPLPVIQVIDKCTGRPFAFTLTYVLDFATPEMVTVEVAPGTLVSLQTPAELGLTLPVTHIFQAWTYLGQDITEIVVREDIIVEGRTDVVGANRLFGSQYLVGFNTQLSFDETSFSTQESPFTGAEVVAGIGYNMLRTIKTTISSGNFLFCMIKPAGTLGFGNKYAFSALFQVQNTTPLVIYTSFGVRELGIRAWVNGEECVCTWHGGRGKFGIIVPDIPINTPVMLEIVGVITELVNAEIIVHSLGFYSKMYSENMGNILVWLPKQEDVTDRAVEDQRATAWVPHADDPVGGGAAPPPDPNQPAAVAGNTDLAQNLIQRYSNGTDTVYDLPIEVGREGDYEAQFSYGDTVIARSSFAIRRELCCSKLLQYNNRENDFSTIFTPGQPFHTRVEGEFRPEDDEYGVEDSDFRDQDYGLHQMSASPTAVRKLSFGGEYGSPNFIGNKVNRIFACSEVYIDGERYIRAEGAGVTKEIWSEDYPKYPWKINVEKREQGFFKTEYDIPETT